MVITGVSRGLGAALFDEFLSQGDRILALGRRFSDAQYAAERSEPQRVRLRPTDLAHPAALPPAAELASFVHGAGEVVLVHNAAVIDPVGAIGALPPEQITHAVAVNLTAPMLLTNALLGTGHNRLTVLFISSGAAHRAPGGWSVYGATKRAGEAFVEALAAQHEGDGRVRAASVNPGVMDTDMQGALRRYAEGPAFFPDGDRFVALHERGDLAPPADVARRIIAEHLTLPTGSHRG